MSHDVVWDVEEMTGLVRLRRIYGSRTRLVRLALATIGVGLVIWSSISGWKRWLLAAQMIAAFVLAGLADSRSPFVRTGGRRTAVPGLAGYRLRAVPIIVGAWCGWFHPRGATESRVSESRRRYESHRTHRYLEICDPKNRASVR